MASTSSPRAAISDEELGRMLALMKDSDSVELKVTVPESEQRSAVVSLGIDPLEAQIRQIYFFDTPDLALSGSGVVVRARRVQGKGDDSVVKLRPVVPADLPDELRRSASFFVEVDAMPGGFVCSASLRGTPRKTDIRATVTGGLPLRKLFSREQRAFYAAHAPEGIGLDDLTVLGPIFVLKLRLTPEELDRPEARRRGVALPRRVAPARALDEVPADRGLPGRRRGARRTSTGAASTSAASRRRRRGRRSSTSPESRAATTA